MSPRARKVPEDNRPAWGSPQSAREYALVHPRWIEQLQANPPEGVPVEIESVRGLPWPATFGDYDESAGATHRPESDQGDGYCLQCGGCRFYLTLDGDWGGCSLAGGQYDRQLVFEHWSCNGFRFGAHS